MGEEVKEYNIDGVIVKVYGGHSDRKRVEDAMQGFGKALIEQGYDFSRLKQRRDN